MTAFENAAPQKLTLHIPSIYTWGQKWVIGVAFVVKQKCTYHKSIYLYNIVVRVFQMPQSQCCRN